MAHCVEKLPHSCGSGDGLQVFQQENGKFDGFCFACNTYVPDPYGDNPPKGRIKKQKTADQIQAELQEIGKLRTVDLPERHLRADSLAYFGIKISLSEQDGVTPTLHYYPYYSDKGLDGYKVRLVHNKTMWAVGDIKKSTLFGWPQALVSGSKRLFITEGELDAVALYQSLKDNSRGGKWEHLTPAVVSIRNGAGGAANDIAPLLPIIRSTFAEVVLVFDNDTAGKKAEQEVLKILPTALVATLPCKDANECVIKGKSKALAEAVLFKAGVAKNTRLVVASSLFEAGRKQAEWGLSWPWKGLTELTRGIRFGETTYIGAGVKMGKSEFVNAIAAHGIREHNLGCFLAKPEEANRKSLQMLASKIAGKIFHDPKITFDYEAYDKACELIGDKAVFLDLYQHMGWQALRADIALAASLGYRWVFVDPITNLTNGVNSADANTMLQEVAQELSALAKDLDIHIFIFCHLKAPENGPPHERGGSVLSHQFAGSRAMMRSCNYMIGIEGNKDPNLELEERNIRKIILLEDREFGNVGTIPIYWDHKTGLFNEL